MIGTIRGSFKLALFILWTLCLAPFQIIALPFIRQYPSSYFLPYIWQCGVTRIMALRVIVHGAPVTDKQTIFVSNHISYLDIQVITSVLKASLSHGRPPPTLPFSEKPAA